MVKLYLTIFSVIIHGCLSHFDSSSALSSSTEDSFQNRKYNFAPISDQFHRANTAEKTNRTLAIHGKKRIEPFVDDDFFTNKQASERRSYRRKADDEGLPIEMPVTTKTSTQATTATTPQVLPPLNPRYRRIYDPDEQASVEEFPFIAALLMNKELWCGAAVIDNDKVITAAHCLQLQYNNRFFREYTRMLTVRVGSSNSTAGGDVYRVSSIHFHPNYKPETLEFNVAVLLLHQNITFGIGGPVVEKIGYFKSIVIPIDNRITFLGWGAVLHPTGQGGQALLQKVELPIYDQADCQEVYGRELVTHTNFCAGFIAGRKNVCNHDAGGPAIMDGVLVGVLSFSSKRCDLSDQPAVFTKIGAVSNWLNSIFEGKYLKVI